MHNDEHKKEEIKKHGHNANTDELDALEPATPAGVNEGTETSIPEDTDGMAEENTFSSAPPSTEDQ